MDTPQPPLPETPSGFQPLDTAPPTPVRLGVGIAAGVAMALILGGAWGWLTVVTSREFGLLAWGIGVAVGFGVSKAGQGAGPQLGIVAVVSSLLAILFGKFLIARHFQSELSAVFSFYDLLWVAFAVASAWKLAGIRR